MDLNKIKKPIITAAKGNMGHTIAAAGGIESVIAAL